MQTLREMVNKIQTETGQTIAEIAKEIGYSRTYFTLEIDKNKSRKIRERLVTKYHWLFSHTEEPRWAAPSFAVQPQPQPPNKELELKDKIIALLEEKLNTNLTELKEAQAMHQAILLTVRLALAELLAKYEDQDVMIIADRLNKETAAYLSSTKQKDN